MIHQLVWSGFLDEQHFQFLPKLYLHISAYIFADKTVKTITDRRNLELEIGRTVSILC